MKRVFYRVVSRKFLTFFHLILLFFISFYIFDGQAKSIKSQKPVSVRGVKYAAFVLDVNSGTILHSDNSTALIPPASLTKMMTLHILFEELIANKITLDTPILISQKAARQSPSKLGVPAGDMITVREAILALMTRSANDVAVAVAEHVSGSEKAFVNRMNHRAQSLKMMRTVFQNPSGLPNPQQLTCAYDMALLSKSLLKFTKLYSLFKTQIFHFKGQKIHNHNKLLGKVEGLDGIKTGFVCASGFNIATSAVRQGRRLIGIVMGGETAKWRDRRISQLLESCFLKLPHQPSNMLVFKSPNPLEEDVAQVSAKALKPQMLPTKEAVYTVYDQDLELEADAPNDGEDTLRAGDWCVQLGTYTRGKDAHIQAAMIRTKLPQHYDAQIFVIELKSKKSRQYQARLGHFSKISAEKIRVLLKKKGVSCSILKNSSFSKFQTAVAVQ